MANSSNPPTPQPLPELLRAILNVNPNVFEQQPRTHWGANCHSHNKFNGISPNTVPSSPSSHGTASIPNQQLLATPSQSSPHVNMGSPPSQARPGNQVNNSTQNSVSPIWNSGNSSNMFPSPMSNSNPQNGGFYSLVQDGRNYGSNLSEDKDPLSMSPSNQPDQQRLLMQEKTFEQGNILLYCLWLIHKCMGSSYLVDFLDGNVRPGQSPAQASVAPSPLRLEPQVPQPSMGAPYTPQQQAQNSNQDKQDSSKSTGVINNRYPVVKLGRLSVSSYKLSKNLNYSCHLSSD